MALEGIGALGELALYAVELLGYALRGLGKLVSTVLQALGKRGIIDEAEARRNIEAALGCGLLVIISLIVGGGGGGIPASRAERSSAPPPWSMFTSSA